MAKQLISYYTNDYYKKVASKYLLPSVKKLGLACYTASLSEEGSWIANVNKKPKFMKDCLLMFKKDVLWVDVDAEIRGSLAFFDAIPMQYDIACHILDRQVWYHRQKFKGKATRKEPLIGTLYLRYKLEVLVFLDAWIKECALLCLSAQQVFAQLLKRKKIKIFNLPIEYCYINSLPNGRLPYVKVDNPIIVHYQASREYKSGKHC